MVATSTPPAWDELAKYTVATTYKWCEKNGYDFHHDISDVKTRFRGYQPFPHKDLPLYVPVKSFIKLDLMLHFLDPESCRERYDYVMWIDGDQVITNYDFTIASILARLGYTDGRTFNKVLMPFDFNGNNSTVILAANTDLIYNYLWSCNDSGRSLFLNHDWYEMEAMLRFRLADPYIGIVTTMSAKHLCALHPDIYGLPKRRTQAYEWEPGDFSVHLSALPLPKRVELAKHYCDALELLK